MRARTAWGLAPVLLAAAAATSACIRDSDSLDGHPDVVAVTVLLIAGEDEARLLAVHPHRARTAAAPEVTATLAGPDWTAAFLDEAELGTCTGAADLLGPAKCLLAALPEPVRAGTAYQLRGSAPLGSFDGAMVVPEAPVLVEPADSLLLPAPADGGPALVPVRYRNAAGIGTLLAELLDIVRTNDDGTETELAPSGFGYPRKLDGGLQTDTLPVSRRDRPLRFSLRVLGIGPNYTSFLEHAGSFPVPRPWPSFGLEGEGVYGYFDGAAPSRSVRIRDGGSGHGVRDRRFSGPRGSQRPPHRKEPRMNSRTILAAAASSILPFAPPPQASAQIGVALTGGVNYASMSVTGPDALSVSPVTRYFVGMSGTIPLSANFGIELGGALSQKGGQVDGGEGQVILHFNHYELALLVRAGVPLAGDRIRPYLAAGPTMGWESSCTGKIALFDGGPYEVRPCPAEEFEERDFGLAAGAGFELALSEGLGLTLGAAYALGLRDMEASGGGEVKFRTTTVRGGFVYWIR